MAGAVVKAFLAILAMHAAAAIPGTTASFFPFSSPPPPPSSSPPPPPSPPSSSPPPPPSSPPPPTPFFQGGKDPRCPIAFANFGDSLSDTGNTEYAFPFTADAENPPYGETYFGKPAKRFSNGRLIMDFFVQAFGVPLLDPYLAIEFNYRSGVNFAAAGATASPISTAQSPFSLLFQIAQFIRFSNSAQFISSQPSQPACLNFVPKLPSTPTDYSKWLFTITIGSNDLELAIRNGTSFATITATVTPLAISNIKSAVQTLYSQGALKFLISGIPPLGCLASLLTLISFFNPSYNQTIDPSNGCLAAVNDQVVTPFNNQLRSAIPGLQSSLPGSTISFFDFYAAATEIGNHPSAYGFNETLKVCCGAPGLGTLNYNPASPCGRPGSNNCATPDQYVQWDGLHLTEAAYRVFAKFILAGNFTDNPINYTSHCDLSFARFDHGSYSQDYLRECRPIFN